MTFKESIEQFGADNLEFVVKAANYSGMLETEKKIEVHDWDDLISALVCFIDSYLTDEDGLERKMPKMNEAGFAYLRGVDFFDALESALIEEFPPAKGPPDIYGLRKDEKVWLYPMTLDEIKANADENNYISGVVKLDVFHYIGDSDNNYLDFVDALSEILTGTKLLTEISHEVAGSTKDGRVLIRVRGNAKALLTENN